MKLKSKKGDAEKVMKFWDAPGLCDAAAIRRVCLDSEAAHAFQRVLESILVNAPEAYRVEVDGAQCVAVPVSFLKKLVDGGGDQ